ncbi:MAG: DNA primase, partial [Patescibacteria group bacterium]|nr:DNA primase [Patescibacteria group bacterium]
MSTTTEQIKERLSIADLISGYVKLERAGANFKARCPFHNEKTPSFFVSPSRNTYYCFGCGKSGDVFTFVQEFDGLDFRGALKMLAERTGVVLVDEPRESADERARLFAALESACVFFEQGLGSAPEAREYLLGRGLTEASITHWRIGFVKEGWSTLRDELALQGFRERELEGAGLIKRGERSFYDRFRSRIMFPISDSAGRVVAFSGRIFGQAGQEGDAAKYLNSPETELFHKSSLLYGFDKAKHTIRTLRCAIVVEGQMDLILSHQAGFTNTVALSGTALTDVQCKLLKRLTDNMIIALDADSAGIAAAGRSATIALGLGMDVKVARLPEGKDPADLIKESREAWKSAIRSAMHVVEFYLTVLEQRHATDRRALRREAARVVIPFLAAMSGAIDRAHFISLVAARLALPESAIMEEVVKYRETARRIPPSAEEAGGAAADARVAAESGSTAAPTEHEQLLRRHVGIYYWIADDVALAALVPEFARAFVTALGGDREFRETAVRFSENRDTLIF